MRQRAMIAMAMANEPALLIADEPTTALDVTIQAQVIDVFVDAKQSTGAAAVLVTHDLGLVAEVTDRVYVMYAGSIVESGDTSDVFRNPAHPYTIGLLASRPSLTGTGGQLHAIPGQPPTLSQPPSGCMFRDRCPVGRDREPCAQTTPPLVEIAPGRHAACHFVDETADWATVAVAR
jgi:oligopeptide/dipeptide ABC transporter ATP-binding protein